MSMLLPQLFEQSLAQTIDRKDNAYLVVEDTIPYQFKAPNENTMGFRIVPAKFNFLGRYLPPGIAKMCDAIFVVRHNDEDFILTVEIKTTKKRYYKKQLWNGRWFCEWLVQLLKDHEHYSGKPQYLGLLVWEPNFSQINKSTTTRMKDKSIAISPMIIYEKIGTTIELRDYLKTS